MEDAWFTLSYSPFRDESQEISGVLVTVFETTAKVQTEKARQVAEAGLKEVQNRLNAEQMRLAELFEQAPAFMAVLHGPDHIFERTNPRYKELVGRDVLGKSLREAIPEAEAQGFPALLDDVYRTGKSFSAHNEAVDLARSPGQPLERRYVDFVYQAIHGATSGIMVLGVDVTQRKQAEDALRTTEKLVAVGRLATSIAHEINNPLEAVTNLLYLARLSTSLEEVQSYLETAEVELRRASAISSQTLRFHKQSTNPTLATCGDLIGSTLTVYQGRLKNLNIFKLKRGSVVPGPFCVSRERSGRSSAI